MHPVFQSYYVLLQTLHRDIKQAIDGLPPEALDWSPAPGVNSIAVLAAHTAGAERNWIGIRAGQRTLQRDRAGEFQVKALDATALLTLLDESQELARDVLENLSVADLTRPAGLRHDDVPVDTAWALWHALEHTAQHSGHIQITRQWWEARESK
jgi:uncharacterized damage-inducible protein DinB